MHLYPLCVTDKVNRNQNDDHIQQKWSKTYFFPFAPFIIQNFLLVLFHNNAIIISQRLRCIHLKIIYISIFFIILFLNKKKKIPLVKTQTLDSHIDDILTSRDFGLYIYLLEKLIAKMFYWVMWKLSQSQTIPKCFCSQIVSIAKRMKKFNLSSTSRHLFYHQNKSFLGQSFQFGEIFVCWQLLLQTK